MWFSRFDNASPHCIGKQRTQSFPFWFLEPGWLPYRFTHRLRVDTLRTTVTYEFHESSLHPSKYGSDSSGCLVVSLELGYAAQALVHSLISRMPQNLGSWSIALTFLLFHSHTMDLYHAQLSFWNLILWLLARDSLRLDLIPPHSKTGNEDVR